MIKNIRLVYRLHPHDNGVLNGGTWHWQQHGVGEYVFFECTLSRMESMKSFAVNDILGHLVYLLGQEKDYYNYRLVASRAHRQVRHQREYLEHQEIITLVRVTPAAPGQPYVEQPVLAIALWADAVLVSNRSRQTNTGWEIKFSASDAQSLEDFVAELKSVDRLPLEVTADD